jgi:hypothetical protein
MYPFHLLSSCTLDQSPPSIRPVFITQLPIFLRPSGRWPLGRSSIVGTLTPEPHLLHLPSIANRPLVHRSLCGLATISLITPLLVLPRRGWHFTSPPLSSHASVTFRVLHPAPRTLAEVVGVCVPLPSPQSSSPASPIGTSRRWGGSAPCPVLPSSHTSDPSKIPDDHRRSHALAQVIDGGGFSPLPSPPSLSDALAQS